MLVDFTWIAHLFAVMLLVGFTLQAIGAPILENRRRLVLTTGALSLVVFGSGLFLAEAGSYASMGWIMVKVLCVMLLSSVTPLVFRRPESAQRMLPVVLVIVLVALIAVHTQSF